MVMTMSIEVASDTYSVGDVMLPIDRIPVVQETALVKESLELMAHHHLGIVCVVGNNFHLDGLLTDGDVRRIILEVQKPFSALLADDTIIHSNRNPITIAADNSILDAVTVMEEQQIWDLPVVNLDGTLVGLFHLHPAVKVLLSKLNRT
jgi:arabinose-5-phosphate isomerase